MAWGTVSEAQRSVDGVARKRKKQLGQVGVVSAGTVGDEGGFQRQVGAVGLTSCKQVYWTWYGATFSSPLISTLMCSRMAPDTADLSVLLSAEQKQWQCQNCSPGLFSHMHNCRPPRLLDET